LTLHSQRICFSNSVYKNIEIRALEKGSCKIYVDEGQYVKRVSCCSKYATVYEAEYQKQSQKGCRDRVQNTKVLSDKNVVSKNELAVARARLDQAKAEMVMAKFHLSATNIKAPFSGTIDRIPKKLGSLIE
jgi:membrane fusion protein (multidrug efflux system)